MAAKSDGAIVGSAIVKLCGQYKEGVRTVCERVCEVHEGCSERIIKIPDVGSVYKRKRQGIVVSASGQLNVFK